MDFLTRSNGSGHDAINNMVAHVHDAMREVGPLTAAGAAVVSLESLNDAGRNAIQSVQGSIQKVVGGMREKLKLSTEQYTQAQTDAASQAGMMAANINGALKMRMTDGFPSKMDGKSITMEAFGPDVNSQRSYAQESYNESDNRSAVAYSITYNLQSARQDDFGETLFPTITIPADQAGVTITSNLLFVMDNVDRDVSGKVYDLARKNVLRAVADPTVLRKEQTRAVPVYRNGQNDDKFVPSATVAPRSIDIDGQVFTTSPILFAKQVDLLSLSTTDALVASGVQNQTDTLDPTVEVQTVYVAIPAASGTQKLAINTQLPYFNFVPNAQQDYKLLTLSADTTSVLLNKDTKAIGGAALTGPAAQIAADDLIVRMHLALNGNVRTDTGNMVVYGAAWEVSSITDAASGDKIALTDASVTALVASLNTVTWLGYDPLAYRSNANRRQQGQFVDVSKEYQRYLVPLRSPITARHPAHIDGQIDASDVQALITTTRIRVSNEAVTAILAAADLLASYIDVRDNVGEAPDVLGVGRYYVRGAFISRPFDAEAKVDSIKSFERAKDISAALVNEIRDIAYLLYRDSEYKAAADALYGGVGPLPTVIVATDPYTARYINVEGDLRTLGGEFAVKVVSTLDVRFRGKIVIAFGVFDAERNSAINPLNNGNLLWAPELVLTANIGRGGQYSRETLVQPRYRFITNLPVLGVIQVSNIPNVLNKLPLFMADVTP